MGRRRRSHLYARRALELAAHRLSYQDNIAALNHEPSYEHTDDGATLINGEAIPRTSD
jgi:hypothetical protein